MHKGTEKWAKNKRKEKNLRFFINFPLKILVVQEKVVPLHPQNRTREFWSNNILGYGVMVTLQILVLPFLVRVRVPQLKKTLSSMLSVFCFCISKRNPAGMGGILYLCFVFSVDGLNLLANKIHIILQFLYLAVHLVDKAVTLLRAGIQESEVVLVGLNL